MPTSRPRRSSAARVRQPSPPTPVARTPWVGQPYPLGATYDGSGTNFSLFTTVADGVELCLLGDSIRDRVRPADRHRGGAHRAARGRRLLLAHLPPRCPPRAALRLPRPRPLGPRQRAVVQPGEAAPRPIRQGRRRRGRLGPRLLRLRPRRIRYGRARPTAPCTFRSASSATPSSTGPTTGHRATRCTRRSSTRPTSAA